MLDVTKMMLTTLKNLVFKGEGVEEVSGPVGIISFVSGQVKEGWYMILYIVFLISLNLGIMNLLPLPALDGGRLVFLIVEGHPAQARAPGKGGHGARHRLFAAAGAHRFGDVSGHRPADYRRLTKERGKRI